MVDSTLMYEINDTKNLTQEEIDGIEKYKEALEKRRAYNREYMANRRKTDTEFYAKQKENNNRYKKEKYATDAEFRKSSAEYLKKYRAEKNKYKDLYKEILAKSK